MITVVNNSIISGLYLYAVPQIRFIIFYCNYDIARIISLSNNNNNNNNIYIYIYLYIQTKQKTSITNKLARSM